MWRDLRGGVAVLLAGGMVAGAGSPSDAAEPVQEASSLGHLGLMLGLLGPGLSYRGDLGPQGVLAWELGANVGWPLVSTFVPVSVGGTLYAHVWQDPGWRLSVHGGASVMPFKFMFLGSGYDGLVPTVAAGLGWQWFTAPRRAFVLDLSLLATPYASGSRLDYSRWQLIPLPYVQVGWQFQL